MAIVSHEASKTTLMQVQIGDNFVPMDLPTLREFQGAIAKYERMLSGATVN